MITSLSAPPVIVIIPTSASLNESVSRSVPVILIVSLSAPLSIAMTLASTRPLISRSSASAPDVKLNSLADKVLEAAKSNWLTPSPKLIVAAAVAVTSS